MFEILFCSSRSSTNITDPIHVVAQPSAIPDFYLKVPSDCSNAGHYDSIPGFRKEDMRKEG